MMLVNLRNRIIYFIIMITYSTIAVVDGQERVGLLYTNVSYYSSSIDRKKEEKSADDWINRKLKSSKSKTTRNSNIRISTSSPTHSPSLFVSDIPTRSVLSTNPSKSATISSSSLTSDRPTSSRIVISSLSLSPTYFTNLPSLHSSDIEHTLSSSSSTSKYPSLLSVSPSFIPTSSVETFTLNLTKAKQASQLSSNITAIVEDDEMERVSLTTENSIDIIKMNITENGPASTFSVINHSTFSVNNHSIVQQNMAGNNSISEYITNNDTSFLIHSTTDNNNNNQSHNTGTSTITLTPTSNITISESTVVSEEIPSSFKSIFNLVLAIQSPAYLQANKFIQVLKAYLITYFKQHDAHIIDFDLTIIKIEVSKYSKHVQIVWLTISRTIYYLPNDTQLLFIANHLADQALTGTDSIQALMLVLINSGILNIIDATLLSNYINTEHQLPPSFLLALPSATASPATSHSIYANTVIIATITLGLAVSLIISTYLWKRHTYVTQYNINTSQQIDMHTCPSISTLPLSPSSLYADNNDEQHSQYDFNSVHNSLEYSISLDTTTINTSIDVDVNTGGDAAIIHSHSLPTVIQQEVQDIVTTNDTLNLTTDDSFNISTIYPASVGMTPHKNHILQDDNESTITTISHSNSIHYIMNTIKVQPSLLPLQQHTHHNNSFEQLWKEEYEL